MSPRIGFIGFVVSLCSLDFTQNCLETSKCHASTDSMRSMINLGLERTARLLQLIAQNNQQSSFRPPWTTIHIAGTNGKGSVAAYLSALLRRTSQLPKGQDEGSRGDQRLDSTHKHGLRIGRFTSPHFIDRWDCIVINDRPITQEKFRQTEQEVESLAKQVEQQLIEEAQQRNDTSTGSHAGNHSALEVPEQVLRDARPTNFEVLTATAFSIFSQSNPTPCDVAVVECGLGGRLDSTNVLPTSAIAVSVITRIGLDHLDMLGGSLRSIVREKCGILREDVPVVIDGDNTSDVLCMIRDELQLKFGSEWEQQMAHYVHDTDIARLNLSQRLPGHESPRDSAQSQFSHLERLLPHQKTNLAMAIKAIEIFAAQDKSSKQDFSNQILSPSTLEAVLADASKSYPARLQLMQPGWLDDASGSHNLWKLNTLSLLLDGAHNEQSAVVLRNFVDRETLRSNPDLSTGPGRTLSRTETHLIDTQRTTIWILALSPTKPPADILRTLFLTTDARSPEDKSKSNDNNQSLATNTPPNASHNPNFKVIFTQFSPPDNMPWVKPATNKTLLSAASTLGFSTDNNILGTTSNIIEALDLVESLLTQQQQQEVQRQDPLVVVAGSLYLASDFLRFLRDGRDGFLRHFQSRDK